MKKINLIEWLWKTDSHEKQTPQRFARYAAILIMLLTIGVGQMWADVAGFWSDGAAQVTFTVNERTVSADMNSSGFSEYDLGTVESLTLKSAWAKTWKNGGNVCGVDMYYKVSTTKPNTTSMTKNELRTFEDLGSGNQKISKSDINTSLTGGLTAGTTYYITINFDLYGNKNSSSGCYTGNGSLNNGNSQYIFKFKMADSNTKFTQGKYIYLDARNQTNWKSADFTARFYFKRYDTDADIANVTCANTNKLDSWVYYAVVPAGNYNGKLQVDRVNPNQISEQWCTTSVVAASGRSSGNNCLGGSSSSCAWSSPSWTTYAPPLSAVSLSDNGTVILAGGGTELNPYLIATGATIKVIASGTKAVADPDATIWYDIKDNTTSKQNSSTATYSFTASASANTVYQMKVDGYTKVSSTSSTTLTSSIIYYKTVSVKNISVYIYVGSCTSDQINSIELFGTPYVGSVALDDVHYYIGAFTTDGNWRKYTFTNVSEVQDLVVARSGGRAIDNITATADVYAKWDGTALDGKCVDAPNPTWNAAPRDGAVGGSFTASVTGAPAGATVSWSSTNSTAASVNASGVISYNAVGNATIKANVSWDATGDYCSGSYELSQAITVTSGATVSATRTCPAYVAAGVEGQVTLDISSTGASTGWYYRIYNGIGYEGPDNVNASSNSASWTMTGGINAGSNSYTIILYNGSGVEQARSSAVSVTGETAFSTTIAAGSNGSVSPSGTVYANNDHVHPSITATPSSNYHFVNWTSDNNTYASVADDDETTTTVTARESGHTITANFAGDQYSITYKDQGDVAFSGSHVDSPSAHPTTHTYGAATTLNSATKTGYSFGGWFTTSNCASGTDVTSLGATAYTSNITLYAKWTEVMSDLTTSCHYDAGTPGYAAPTVSGSATNVGYATTRTITATAAGTGYTFAGWTLTNCTRTDGGGATATSITIRSNGDGEDVSVVANYTEVLTTNWYITGATGTNYPFTGWGTSGTRMSKKSGHSTEEIYYCNITVNRVASGNEYEFQTYNHGNTTYYGYNNKDIDKEHNSTTVYSNNPNNMRFKPYVIGTYEFKLDNTGADPVLTVTWPVFNQVRISAASPSDAGNVGNYDLSAPVSNVRTVTRSLEANTTYTFKVVYDSEWYGNNDHTFTRETGTSSNTRTIATSSDDMTLTTDYAGDYTFRFNQSTKALSIDFPEAYKVTYGKGAVNGSASDCSAVDLDNSSASVTSNSTWVKKGHHVKLTAPIEDSGYTFDGWFDNNSSTGDAITTAKNCTITVASAETYYACYHEHKTAITINTDGHGTITTPDPNESPYSLGVATMQDINASANTGYHWNTWTVSGTAAVNSSAATQSNKAKGDGTVGGTGTVTATFSPNTYRVHFHRNGGAGETVYQNFTYDVAQNLTANSYTKTGYSFAGWALSTGGDVKYANSANVSNLTAENGVDFHLYAKWTPNPYTVVLDKQTSAEGYGGNAGTVANQTVTFDATPATVSGTMPSAANGYAFMGFYSATGGNGRRFIDPSGNWVTSAGDTISGGNWVKPAGITLYAYYKQAEITGITFTDGAVVAPNTSKTVTAVISPTPTGTTTVCWRVLYSNDNPMAPQPSFSSVSGNSVSFTAPAASGMYKMEAVLHLGGDCEGTELSTYAANFQVAGDHEVTIQYLCGGEAIKASETVTARPLDWSDDITAPDIFGYTFSRWVALDGVSIKDHANDTSTTATIQIKAVYDGKLKAEYSQNSIIYFKNTLGWENVYVNFYSSSYWNNPKGSGNEGVTNRNKMMTRIGDTDVWYYDYGLQGMVLPISGEIILS